MGLLGRYIDGLSDPARDRIVEAQDWCVATLVGPNGARCLVGHAEDWRAMPARGGHWRDAALAAPLPPESPDRDPRSACSPWLFAFRGMRPADLAAYRARVERWGITGEARLGERFDRLLARRGRAAAIRLVKARAAAAIAPRPRAPHCIVPDPARHTARAGARGD